jgi:hypothetical protein
MSDELPAAPESLPSPPSDNDDRLDRSPDRLVEAKTKPKRRMSDKQLENLRKGREARATNAKAKLEPSFLPLEGGGTPKAPEPPSPEPPTPEP